MAVGVRWDNMAVVHRSTFIMRVLLCLSPLVFVIWDSEALPVQDKQSETNEVLLKNMVDVEELNLTSTELSDLDSDLADGKAEWEESSGKSSKDKTPCKVFFWKTFSSC
ncbi:hypothetical protein DNTS_009729 [Danionella cerebrum]|uniref:Somatostatin/Cortistatin C-terminal domain-containing protein n=1 Tax=Danionella cerebrum TaxID=2873325 RepID=A0A553RNG2_9TELE|nr:hypothetical protein DNTS_009729 [Danionella translucida]